MSNIKKIFLAGSDYGKFINHIGLSVTIEFSPQHYDKWKKLAERKEAEIRQELEAVIEKYFNQIDEQLTC